MACSGNGGRCREFQQWVKCGRKVKDFPAFQRDVDTSVNALLVHNGVAYVYGESPMPMLLEQEHWAIGSGADIAMGAMLAGKTAIEAVEIVIQHSPHCGLGVDWAACR